MEIAFKRGAILARNVFHFLSSRQPYPFKTNWSTTNSFTQTQIASGEPKASPKNRTQDRELNPHGKHQYVFHDLNFQKYHDNFSKNPPIACRNTVSHFSSKIINFVRKPRSPTESNQNIFRSGSKQKKILLHDQIPWMTFLLHVESLRFRHVMGGYFCKFNIILLFLSR